MTHRLDVLRKLMRSAFNETEWADFVQDLGQELDDFHISGRNRIDEVREVVDYFDRRGNTDDLFDRLREIRPDKPWNEAIDRDELPEYPKVLTIKVVVVVMNRHEAESLCENESPELRDELDRCGFAVDRYETERFDWKPFEEEESSIFEILSRFTDEWDVSIFDGSRITIQRVDFDVYQDFFDKDWLDIKSDIAGNYCFFIIDEASLLQETVLHKTQEVLSRIDPRAIFVTSPADARNLNKWLEDYIVNLSDASFDYPFLNSFFMQYENRLSPHHDFLIGNRVQLYRCLKMGLEHHDSLQAWRDHLSK